MSTSRKPSMSLLRLPDTGGGGGGGGQSRCRTRAADRVMVLVSHYRRPSDGHSGYPALSLPRSVRLPPSVPLPAAVSSSVIHSFSLSHTDALLPLVTNLCSAFRLALLSETAHIRAEDIDRGEVRRLARISRFPPSLEIIENFLSDNILSYRTYLHKEGTSRAGRVGIRVLMLFGVVYHRQYQEERKIRCQSHCYW